MTAGRPAKVQIPTNRGFAWFLLAVAVAAPFFAQFGIGIEGLHGESLRYASWALCIGLMPIGLYTLTTPHRLAYDDEALTLPDGERLPWRQIVQYQITDVHGVPVLLTLRLLDGGKRTVKWIWLGRGWRVILRRIPPAVPKAAGAAARPTLSRPRHR